MPIEKGKIGSIPLKESIFGYIPSKDLIVDMYHQKMEMYRYVPFCLLPLVSPLALSFFTNPVHPSSK
jgi:hypothetical protein